MAKKNQLTTSDHLKYSEYTRLLECLHKDGDYRWEMYARLSFCTACRASDVLQFRWCDILNKSSVDVTEQKTGKTRHIPINPSVQHKFRELYELMGRPDRKDYIFGSNRGDKPITIQYVNQILKDLKYKYKLDINHFSTHTFRKTFGRYVYDLHHHSAESLMLLNKIFKHTSIEITKTYIGITQEEISDIFASIDF
jgi:integrase